jgi:hypothetical protein
VVVEGGGIENAANLVGDAGCKAPYNFSCRYQTPAWNHIADRKVDAAFKEDVVKTFTHHIDILQRVLEPLSRDQIKSSIDLNFVKKDFEATKDSNIIRLFISTQNYVQKATADHLAVAHQVFSF